MKKSILKIISAIFCVAFLMAGCATVSDVYDREGHTVFYDDVQYYQGQVALIGDYLYYGNGYTATSESEFDYNKAADTGYLSRIKANDTLSYDDKVKNENKQYTSPLGIEKVNGKLIGYENQDMFALGSYLYFTSANTHKTSNLENDYSQVSLFRVKFNGDDFTEIGTFKHNDKCKMEVVKAGQDYYIVLSASSSEESYDLFSIKIGDTLGATKTLAEKVETFALCDNNSTTKNVLYTVNSENTELATDSVKAVDIVTGDVTTLDPGVALSTTKLLDRKGDIVFYSYSYKAKEEIYFKQLSTGENEGNYFYPTSSQKFYDATEISGVKTIGDGYVFVSNRSTSLMYKGLDVQEIAKPLLTKDEYSDVMFVDGDYVYYSDDKSISRVNVKDMSKETIVTVTTSIISGQCGYTNDYIYFYAQLPEIEDEDDQDDEEEKEIDENYYLFRTDKQGNYQLIGQTK